MDRQRKERIVDDVLNRALGPQRIEPREGFEQRILANLATVPPRRSWWRWMWVPALAAAALLAIAIGMRMMQHETPRPIEAKKTGETPKQEATVKPLPIHTARIDPHVVARQSPRHLSAVVASAESLPRKDIFPAPVPLTEQERLLLAFVHRNLDQAKTIAFEQQAERERIQKYFDGNDSPAADTVMPQNKR